MQSLCLTYCLTYYCLAFIACLVPNYYCAVVYSVCNNCYLYTQCTLVTIVLLFKYSTGHSLYTQYGIFDLHTQNSVYTTANYPIIPLPSLPSSLPPSLPPPLPPPLPPSLPPSPPPSLPLLHSC